MSETIRSFIAIELDSRVREELKRIQDECKRLDTDVKWVAPKNIHLTLKFLGHITQEQAASVKEILPNVIKDFAPFEIEITSLGAFPRPERPKVIWAGIERGKELVEKIAENIEESLYQLGFEKETRPFSSHITVGRVRSFKNQQRLTKALKETNLSSPLSQLIKHIILFKSTLTPQGPIYESLQTFDLNSGTS